MSCQRTIVTHFLLFIPRKIFSWSYTRRGQINVQLTFDDWCTEFKRKIDKYLGIFWYVFHLRTNFYFQNFFSSDYTLRGKNNVNFISDDSYILCMSEIDFFKTKFLLLFPYQTTFILDLFLEFVNLMHKMAKIISFWFTNPR